MGKGCTDGGAQVSETIVPHSAIPEPKNKDDLATRGLVQQMSMETGHRTGKEVINCPGVTQVPMAGDQDTTPESLWTYVM